MPKLSSSLFSCSTKVNRRVFCFKCLNCLLVCSVIVLLKSIDVSCFQCLNCPLVCSVVILLESFDLSFAFNSSSLLIVGEERHEVLLVLEWGLCRSTEVLAVARAHSQLQQAWTFRLSQRLQGRHNLLAS